MTVAIPARNEEAEIEECLIALATQKDVPPFEVVMLANNCTDRTVERALALAARLPDFRCHVCVETLPKEEAHVGTARKMLMDRCAARFVAAGRRDGIVATTDADTTVARDWVAQTFEEMRRVDAVAGCVEIRDSDRALMGDSMRDLYERELLHRQLWSELEALVDPMPEDPLPRHSSFVAASVAVSADMYERVGGLQPIAALEDRVFLHSLRRVDARVRHSLRVRAYTSGRTRSRVRGGFATFVNHLHNRAPEDGSYDVTDPNDLVRDATCRAALRKIWHGSGTSSDTATIANGLGIAPSRYTPLIDEYPTFGSYYERVVAIAPSVVASPMVPLDDAIATMSFQLSARSGRATGTSPSMR